MNKRHSRCCFISVAVAIIALFVWIAGLGDSATPATPAAKSPQWKAGTARVSITPQKPIWMTGFGSRTKPSEGVLQELHARALALEDDYGNRAVLVATDILGFPAAVAKNIAEQVEKRFRLPRERLMLTSSHTHGGPAIASPIRLVYGARATAEEARDVEEYTRELERKVVGVVGSSLENLRPARLSFGHGEAKFAMNRRQRTETGYTINVSPEGPVDHDVPVLRVESENGGLRAVVFGYACHNTTLLGDIYQIHGDYAGFAQERLEKDYPEAVALFISGCGGDANAQPRGTIDLARQHGETLAGSVEKTIAQSMKPVSGPLRTAFDVFPLKFAAPPGREAIQARLQHQDVFQRWWGQKMLEVLDRKFTPVMCW